jgi:hypothetical protein
LFFEEIEGRPRAGPFSFLQARLPGLLPDASEKILWNSVAAILGWR